MIDKLLINFELTTIFMFLAFVLSSIVSIGLTVSTFLKFNEELIEQCKHGNISASILFSGFILSTVVSTIVLSQRPYSVVLFLLISVIVNLLIFSSFSLIKSILNDFYDEIIINNNLSLSLIITTVTLSISLILSFSFK